MARDEHSSERDFKPKSPYCMWYHEPLHTNTFMLQVDEEDDEGGEVAV